jgi:hypothetical protein
MLQSSLSQIDPKLTYILLSTVTVTLAVMAVILLGWFIYLVPRALHRCRHPLTMEQHFALWHRYGYADGVIYEGKDLGICPICKPSEGAVSLTMTGSLKFDDWSAGQCTTCKFRFILPHRGESHVRFIVHETYRAKRKFGFEQAAKRSLIHV